MKLEEANIDIDCLKEIEERLNSPYLKIIHTKYCASVEQILTMISSPLILMTFAMAKVKEDHLSIQSAVKLGFLVNNPPKDTKETAKKLINFFEEELKKANENIVEDAQKESNNLYDKSEEIRNCFNNIGLNAVVNSWTLFEAYMKDIWIKTLNNKPELLNNKIINAKSDSENGANSKTIPLNLLSKYNYDVSNHLGEILSNKYDFTGVEGIKKAYKDLFDLNESEILFLDKIKLIQLEICRHIIVHNAGIIDSRYLARSKRPNETINENLKLDIIEISEMINYSIECVKSILLLVDDKIICSANYSSKK